MKSEGISYISDKNIIHRAFLLREKYSGLPTSNQEELNQIIRNGLNCINPKNIIKGGKIAEVWNERYNELKDTVIPQLKQFSNSGIENFGIIYNFFSDLFLAKKSLSFCEFSSITNGRLRNNTFSYAILDYLTRTLF